MNFTQKFLGFTVVNLIVLFLANKATPEQVVFGNILLGSTVALVVTALILAFFVSWASEHIDHKKKSPTSLMFTYWLLNSAVIYLIARTPISEIVALGIGSFWVAIALGFVVNLGQYAVWQLGSGKKKQ